MDLEFISRSACLLFDFFRPDLNCIEHWNGLVNSDSLEADAKDAIADLAQFAQVDAAGAQSDDESALIELEEYLKVVAQLVFEAVEVVIPTHRVQ